MISARATLLFGALFLLHNVADAAFYLPGVAPREFQYQDKVELYVNKLTSTKAQLPYRYYELPFCQPKNPKPLGENIGEILMGDRIQTSLYQLFMRYNEYCKILCEKSYSKDDGKKFAKFIKEEYTVDWILDNLPAAVKLYRVDDPQQFQYERGFPLGYSALDEKGNVLYYLFNHIHFVIKYHDEPEHYQGSRIVGFEVEPYSVKHKYEDKDKKKLATCNDQKKVSRDMEPQRIDEGGDVIFTYDVVWEESDIPWSHRWDLYLQGTSGEEDIHWFSIINSLIIVVFLTGIIAMILIRALYRDIAKYNEETAEEAQEETGWKLVHGDVFRPPSGTFGPMLLSVFVGSGFQILAMTAALMVFAVLGFLSPANRGGLLTAMILLFVFMGSVAGYMSSRIFKMFKGKAWKRNTLLTATAFPGTVFGIAFFMNFFVWGSGSTSAVPFGTMLALLVLWFGISTPLVFLGSYFGFKKEEVKAPVRVNQIPRQVPEQPWYLKPLPSIFVGGVLPFGAVFIELFFIMSSIWLHQVYYVFGFLFLVLVILLVTCAEISIVMTYFQLCSEDYNWWWRSFLTPGSSAAYLFLYSILYFFSKLEIDVFTGGMMYFGYMAAAAWAFFLLTGSVGFLSSLWFVRKIYSSIKVD
eukprot:gb/GECG01007392.1/.p1 GENE.gb/GECG01007392.1/~~gb/GECG01007392.1/.p1  ORF type:complete len:638 (+),score=69.90 gb/GECG01007392.1/:1-1914(+)